MLVTISPLITLGLFWVSCNGFVALVGKLRHPPKRTTFQMILQYVTAAAIVMHIVSTIIILQSTYLSNNHTKAEIEATSISIVLEYLNQNILRCISILCLNIAVFIIVSLDPQEGIRPDSVQIAIVTYTALRSLPVIFWHLSLTSTLALQATAIEVFLASEGAFFGIIWLLVYARIGQLRRELQRSQLSEKFFVDATLARAADGSRRFAIVYLLNVLYKLGGIVATIYMQTPAISIIKDVSNTIKIVHHIMNLKVINVWLFIDILYEGEILQTLAEGLAKQRPAGFKFFSFIEESKHGESDVLLIDSV
ncbi:hypothetical protein PAPHI01_1864 [Pancytospora philotis]|nr:hypothetical protein PAPHI01_1864 [Pancytospora philotis]